MRGDWQATDDVAKAEPKRAGLNRLPALFIPVATSSGFQPATGGPDGRLGPAARLRALVEEERAFGRGFLLIPVVVSAGVLWWFSLAESPVWWGLGLYFCIAAVAAVLLRHRQGIAGGASIALALFLGGALLCQIESARLSTVMLDAPVTTHITGLVEARERTATGWRYVVGLTATEDPAIRRPPERVTLVARGNLSPVGIGHTIHGLARLSPPSGPVMPGLVDFGRLSYFNGIGAVGFFYGPPQDQGATAVGDLPLRVALAIETVREMIAGRIRAVLPGDTGAFANAIITGERRALSAAAIDALRNAGLAHIIAISGLHMALAAGIFFSSLRLLLALSPRATEAMPVKKIAASAAIAAALFYLMISGMQVSARRAFIMLAIMLAAAVLDRPAISLRNVALAALVILAVTPSEVVGPGMQMSFAATLALIAGYGQWQKRPSEAPVRARGPLRWLWVAASGIALTALIGGLSTTPFAIHHFSRVAGYGLLGNLLAMPVVGLVVMPAGLLSLLAMPLNLHAPFLIIMGWGLDWVLAASAWVDSLGGAFNTGLAPRGYLLLFLMGFLPLVILRTRLRLIGVLPILLSFALLAWPRTASPPTLLVSGDDDLVAIVDGARLSLNTKRPPSFIFDQWAAALVPDEIVAPQKTADLGFDREGRFEPMSKDELARSARALAGTISRAMEEPGRFQCENEAWCYVLYGPIRVMQVERPGLTGLACDNADIVISRYRPGFRSCHSGAFLITPALRRQSGTLQFTLLSPATSASGQGTTRQPIKSEAGARPAAGTVQTETLHANAVPPPSPCTVDVKIKASVESILRPWNKHRLYDWREQAYDAVIALPDSLSFTVKLSEPATQSKNHVTSGAEALPGNGRPETLNWPCLGFAKAG